MTDEQKTELLARYHYGPFRECRQILAMDANLEQLKKLAASRGEVSWFLTLTFVGEQTPEMIKEWKRDFGVFLRRLKRKFPGICGERIFERGRRTGRFNAHMVVDRQVLQAEMEELRDGLTVGWVYAEPVRDDGVGAYMWKELTKEVGRGGRGRERQMAAFGKFRRSKETDFDLKSDFAYCLQLAWDMHERGRQSREQVREFAMWLETQYLLGKFDLGGPGGKREPVYPEEREVPVCWLPSRGDAWEPPDGGDADFEPSKWEP